MLAWHAVQGRAVQAAHPCWVWPKLASCCPALVLVGVCACKRATCSGKHKSQSAMRAWLARLCTLQRLLWFLAYLGSLPYWSLPCRKAPMRVPKACRGGLPRHPWRGSQGIHEGAVRVPRGCLKGASDRRI